MKKREFVNKLHISKNLYNIQYKNKESNTSNASNYYFKKNTQNPNQTPSRISTYIYCNLNSFFLSTFHEQPWERISTFFSLHRVIHINIEYGFLIFFLLFTKTAIYTFSFLVCVMLIDIRMSINHRSKVVAPCSYITLMGCKVNYTDMSL